MQQETVSKSSSARKPITFRVAVDIAIVFGCIPAIVLTSILCAVAVAFAHAGALPTILTLIVTLLLAFMALILIVRYVDVAVINFQKANTKIKGDDEGMMGTGPSLCACTWRSVRSSVLPHQERWKAGTIRNLPLRFC